MSQTYKLPNFTALFVVVALALVTTGCAQTSDQTNTTIDNSDTSMQQPSGTTASTTPTAQEVAYKDGTYSAVGDYRSPAGPEHINVTVTLKNNIITDATVVPQATVPRSKMMQADFTANFKPQVIGKDITSIHLTKVSGSSLTPGGFNDALAKIETQAQ